jgi:hypothetical protein
LHKAFRISSPPLNARPVFRKCTDRPYAASAKRSIAKNDLRRPVLHSPRSSLKSENGEPEPEWPWRDRPWPTGNRTIGAKRNGRIVKVGSRQRWKEKSGSLLSRMLSGEQSDREATANL